MKITLKDDVKEFQPGITVYDIAKSIGDGLARATTGALVNGEVKELTHTITTDSKVDYI